jgi:integrase
MWGKGMDDLVFVDSTMGSFPHRPDTSVGRQSWFVTSLCKADLERLTPHDLRHTAASLAISAGANVKAVQRMLGRKPAAMTLDTYADLFEDDPDAVAQRLHEQASESTDVGLLWG